MAGVGLTWYTWFEQGRNINVSPFFLDQVARVLKMDEAERYHLFILAHGRPPAISINEYNSIPQTAHILLKEVKTRPVYIFNLLWDVLAWNAAADVIFCFSDRPKNERNMLKILFGDGNFQRNFLSWPTIAPQVVACFRRDLVRSPDTENSFTLIEEMETRSKNFASLWRKHQASGYYRSTGPVNIEYVGSVGFERSIIMVDTAHHLSMAFYTPEYHNMTIYQRLRWARRVSGG